MGKIVGIDLGTTNSVVAVMEGGEPTVIANEEGSRTTPSVVTLTEDGEWQVGQVAKRQAITNPQQTIFSIKRFMGRKFNEITSEAKGVPYEVMEDEHNNARISIKGKKYSPEEISAKVLMKLKKAAEAYLGQPVTDAVITVPAYFNDAQRNATKDAGEIAGLNVRRIVNEPTAAAMAYGLEKKEDETIAIYDFGGGTFDISILEVGENVVEVKATNGDTHLGGDNFDQVIIDWLIDEFRKDQGVDLSKDPMALQRLKEAAERAKIELSNLQETDINLPFITADASGPKHLNIKLSRSSFEQKIEDMVERSFGPVKQALKDAGLEPSGVDEVVMVGGSTRIPLILKKVEEFFGKAPNRSVNPDEVVAIGAAVQAGVLSGDVKDLLLLDVTPLSLGIETLGGVMTKLVERNTTIPIKRSQTFSTAEDGQTSVEVHVLQGERPMAGDNRTLGRFHLQGIPPAPRGVPQVEVTFDLDANGIVNVSAKDKGTGKEANIVIDRDSSTGLSKDEVNNLAKEAEQHAADDKAKLERAQTKNELDNMIYQTDKLVTEHKDKLDASDVTALEEALKEGREALKTEETEQMKSAMEKIKQASFKLSEVLYKQAGAEGAGPGAPGTGEAGGGEPGTNGATSPSDDDVIDAEFEEADGNQ